MITAAYLSVSFSVSLSFPGQRPRSRNFKSPFQRSHLISQHLTQHVLTATAVSDLPACLLLTDSVLISERPIPSFMSFSFSLSVFLGSGPIQSHRSRIVSATANSRRVYPPYSFPLLFAARKIRPFRRSLLRFRKFLNLPLEHVMFIRTPHCHSPLCAAVFRFQLHRPSNAKNSSRVTVNVSRGNDDHQLLQSIRTANAQIQSFHQTSAVLNTKVLTTHTRAILRPSASPETDGEMPHVLPKSGNTDHSVIRQGSAQEQMRRGIISAAACKHLPSHRAIAHDCICISPAAPRGSISFLLLTDTALTVCACISARTHHSCRDQTCIHSTDVCVRLFIHCPLAAWSKQLSVKGGGTP